MTDATAAAALLARKTRSGHRASTTRLVDQAATAMEAEVDNDQLSLTGVAEQGAQSPPQCTHWGGLAPPKMTDGIYQIGNSLVK